MPDLGWMLLLVVFLALAFDFINGFHDTANAITCSVSTGVLTPPFAIALAASMNLLGALWSTHVAATIGKGLIDPTLASSALVASALVSAIAWNLITWKVGLPSSSSHALMGGVMGAAVAGHGVHCLHLEGVLKIVMALVISPFLGFVVALSVMTGMYYVLRRQAPKRIRRIFRPAQVLAASAMSFSHGLNDAQKSMGIILLALIGAHQVGIHEGVPLWVKVSCAFAMAGGTAVGGWKIIKTMGAKIVKLQPASGFASDLTSASVIFSASTLGLPVSTTHVAASSIMGVGFTGGPKAVNWTVAGNIVMAWLFTIPATFTLGAALFIILHGLKLG